MYIKLDLAYWKWKNSRQINIFRKKKKTPAFRAVYVQKRCVKKAIKKQR